MIAHIDLLEALPAAVYATDASLPGPGARLVGPTCAAWRAAGGSG